MPKIHRTAKVDDESDFEIDLSEIEEDADDIEAMLGEDGDEDAIEQAIKETEVMPATAEKAKRKLSPKDLKKRSRRTPRARAARRTAAQRAVAEKNKRAAVNRRAAARRAPARRTARRAARRRAKAKAATATRVSVLPKGQVSLKELAEMAGITVPGMYMALTRNGYEKNPDTGRWSFTKSEARAILRELKTAERARIGTDTVGPGIMGGISHDPEKVKKAGGWGGFKSKATNRGGTGTRPGRAARRAPARRAVRRAARRVVRRSSRRAARRAKRK